MAMRCVMCFILGYISFALLPNSQTIASPLSIGKFNVSQAVDKVGRVINGAKTLLGLGPGTTTTNPPTTTKPSLIVVFIPKNFSKKVNNASEKGTISRELTTPKPTRLNGFIQGTKSWWNKAKSYWSQTTTSRPPNVLLVPVDWNKVFATTPPCSKDNIGQGCLSSQLAGFSWWTLCLSLAGALLMGLGAWFVFRRRLPGAFATPPPPDSVEVRPSKLPWPWYPSDPDCISSRGPAPLPPTATKMTAGPLSAVQMTPLPPPYLPAPPVPAPASNRANSMYQATASAKGHVYATPTPPPYSAWASNTNEHVHIYEIPPCFPTYDFADQEIDTTALKKAAVDPKQARC